MREWIQRKETKVRRKTNPIKSNHIDDLFMYPFYKSTVPCAHSIYSNGNAPRFSAISKSLKYEKFNSTPN